MRTMAWKQDVQQSRDWAMERMYEAQSDFEQACASNDEQAAQEAWGQYWHYRRLWLGE